MTTAQRRHPVLVFCALGLAAAIFLIPLHPGARDKLALTTALARVAGGESYALSAPIILVEQPLMVLERGTVSIELGDQVTGVNALLQLLTVGRARMAINDAVISIGPNDDITSGLRNAAGCGGNASKPHLRRTGRIEFQVSHDPEVGVGAASS